LAPNMRWRQPVHLTEAYHRFGAAEPGSLMVTEALAQEMLSLPIYPELSPGSVDYVIQCLLEFSGRLQDVDVQSVWPHELTSHSYPESHRACIASVPVLCN
jgi:hypothetical protein